MRLRRLVPWIGIALLQLVMTQVVTFLASFFLGDTGEFQQTHSAWFAGMLGAAFTAGAFLAGGLGLRLRWVVAQPMWVARLVGALVGAYLPLGIALILYRTLEPGNPFFLVSAVAAVVGFHLPSWVRSG
jgi:hypothetical protein